MYIAAKNGMAREDGRKGRDGECKEGIYARQILVLTLDLCASRMKEEYNSQGVIQRSKQILQELRVEKRRFGGNDQ